MSVPAVLHAIATMGLVIFFALSVTSFMTPSLNSQILYAFPSSNVLNMNERSSTELRKLSILTPVASILMTSMPWSSKSCQFFRYVPLVEVTIAVTPSEETYLDASSYENDVLLVDPRAAFSSLGMKL